MADYLIHDSTLEDIADAIRAKTGGSSLIEPEDMPTEIASISGGGLPTGMTNIGSGSFTFASQTSTNTQIDHGLSFTPRCVIIWTNAELSIASTMFYCLLTRQLANNTGVDKTVRHLVIRTSSTSGIELNQYSASDIDFFITSTTFNVGHGARYYAAGETYNWFAFD